MCNTPNFIDLVENAILDDDCNRDKESDIMLSVYRSATIPERKKIDAVLVALCGWSIPRLVLELDGELAIALVRENNVEGGDA